MAGLALSRIRIGATALAVLVGVYAIFRVTVALVGPPLPAHPAMPSLRGHEAPVVASVPDDFASARREKAALVARAQSPAQPLPVR